ncbi:signal peptide-containing protein [Theileria equi strain WA]|uniref:Signal peptide-containing protein n=1 Tax=Theileria equi strain WA TaxID=1537102 RepID=L0AWZ0_THEEQ|nr:signal peptide-containing protein [Theileria equi strain WA]AFZ80075.1 signal peptide-containing protein [Theileria equi strain WA]|eukprot:XP_004829741.1 signal peptide-containing protein [Theileria equi strain WA]
MKILAVLWTVSLVGLCRCGDDEDDRAVEIHSSGRHLDVSSIEPSLYNLYGCNYDGNEVIFVVPQEGVLVTKVLHSTATIWTPEDGEKFEYAKVFLKDGSPNLLGIIKRTPAGPNCRWYARNGDVWEGCNDHLARIKAIRVPIPRINPFILNIEDDRDTRECRIFNIKLLGIQMRLYFAKLGFLATEVRDNGTPIWKAEEGRNEACISANLYFIRREPALLLIAIKVGMKVEFRCFERINGEWDRLALDVFRRYRMELMESTDTFREPSIPGRQERPRWSKFFKGSQSHRETGTGGRPSDVEMTVLSRHLAAHYSPEGADGGAGVEFLRVEDDYDEDDEYSTVPLEDSEC